MKIADRRQGIEVVKQTTGHNRGSPATIGSRNFAPTQFRFLAMGLGEVAKAYMLAEGGGGRPK